MVIIMVAVAEEDIAGEGVVDPGVAGAAEISQPNHTMISKNEDITTYLSM